MLRLVVIKALSCSTACTVCPFNLIPQCKCKGMVSMVHEKVTNSRHATDYGIITCTLLSDPGALVLVWGESCDLPIC